MKKILIASLLLVSACGGSAPTVTHATIVHALKRMCAAVQALPDETPAPTSGGEATP